MSNHRIFAAALAAGLLAATSLVAAEERPSARVDPGFNPDTGQINEGVSKQPPSQASITIPVPTPQQTLAAKMTPIPTQPSAGDNPTAVIELSPVQTTGSGNNDNPSGAGANAPPPAGPIGSTGETIPAKYSKRNDILDRTPILALPLNLDQSQRQQIFQAAMADKAPAANNADALNPASQLSTDQALNGLHPLPQGLQDIELLKKYKYVKGKDKVLLVEPSTRIVVDQMTKS